MRPRSKPDALTILLVRPRLIGDVILTTPLIRALRRRFPDAQLLYLVEALAAPVVMTNPAVSEVIVIRHRRGWRRIWEDLRLAARLRAKHIDVAIDLHGGPRSSWLTWATRARMRVGYDVSGRRWMYTHVAPKPRGYAPRHSVRNQWDLLGPVDAAFADPPDPDRDRVEMPVSDRARAATAARLQSIGMPPSAQIVVLHVGAGNAFRRWAPDKFATVARTLAGGGTNRWIIVLGSQADADVVAGVMKAAPAAGSDGVTRIVPAVGWPLEDVRALMDRAILFVGGDSGPMHIAATTDVPIAAVFGPTMPVTWAPWRPARLPFAAIETGPLPCRPCDQRACEPGDFRCMTRIEPEMVVAAAERLLEAS
jgi:predicted lipopolysaccharide heptosyltransferase III